MHRHLRDHWAATAANWQGDAPRLQWYATLRDARALVRLADRLRPHLDRAYLAPVDPRWLHLTLHDVGTWRDCRAAEVERLVATAGSLCRASPPLRLRLGPVALRRTAVVVEVAPAEPVWRLRERLWAADVRVRGPAARPLPTGPAATPHVSLAYARRAADASRLADALAELADEPVEVSVEGIELLRLRRDYTWGTVARVELRGP